MRAIYKRNSLFDDQNSFIDNEEGIILKGNETTKLQYIWTKLNMTGKTQTLPMYLLEELLD